MRRFILRVAAFLTIQVAIAGVVFWHGSPQDSNHYLSAIQDKLDRLQHCHGNRLLVLGGSNVAFGIHSGNLQKATGLETVNLGLHAALGLDYCLACADEHTRRGDVVVLIPEYELLTGDLQQGDPTTIKQLLQQVPGAAKYFDQQPHRSWKHFLDRDALCQTHQWVLRAWKRIRRRDKPGRIYQRSSFNSYGDVVAHYGCSADADLTKSLAKVDEAQFDEAIGKLNEFAAKCRRRGIDVYLTFPPLPEAAFASSTDVLAQIESRLQSNMEIPLLHRPEEVVFPPDDFFDTAYHLSEAAGAKRTEAIAAALLSRQNPAARISRREVSANAKH